MGFIHEEEEEEEAPVGEEHYDSDSNDDVDRYVFLARQPLPAEASSDDDDDVEGAVVPDGGGGGGRGRKRLLREMLDAPASPSARKARLDHLTAPLAPCRTSGSEAAESGSEDAVRLPDRGKKNKKRGGCGGGKPQVQGAARGKRSRVPNREAGEESHATTATAAALAAEASRRFLCNICGRCFGSHQGLGGHARGHRNRAKHDIAGATHEEKTAASLASVVRADGNHDGFRGNGDNESEDGVIAASHERTIGNGRNEEEMAIGAGNHVDHSGDGNAEEEEKVVAAPSDRCTDGDGAEKIGVRRCHKLATGNGNKIARKTEHRCEVCGKECLTGQALGGHMRKHRTRPG